MKIFSCKHKNIHSINFETLLFMQLYLCNESKKFSLRPILKLVDRLLLVGVLTDEDVGKLLIMINPETWDPNYDKGLKNYASYNLADDI